MSATLLKLTVQKTCATITRIYRKVHNKQMKTLGNTATGKGF